MAELLSEFSPGGDLLADFVRALITSGEVLVSSAELPPGNDGEVMPVLEGLDAQVREELAFTAPSFDPAAANWAAKQFYQACRFLVCRDIPAAEVSRQLAVACPRSREPATDYSADLVFRFLPQLLNVAERSASDDALTVALRGWAKDWPLSSVGARVTGPFAIESFVDSPALLQLYVDRIVQHAAAERIDDPRVADAVRAALGAYPDLAPALASALNRPPAASLP
jgi:hypothetical protein